jgi:hypothetical protein
MTPPTALVDTLNVALVDADGTVTLAGTVTGSPPDKAIATPPPGAALLMTTVPVTESPPTTVDALSVNAITLSAGPAATVTIGDWRVMPLSDAAMMAVPAATAVTVIVALDSPAATVAASARRPRPNCCSSTHGHAARGAGDVNVTVPLDVLPAARFVETSVMLAIPVPVDGAAGELELLQ